MLFSSLTFLFFFLPATIGLYCITPYRFRKIILLSAIIFFYVWGERRYLPIIFMTIALSYAGGIFIEKFKYKKLCLILFILLDLSLLIYFKYANFVLENLNLIFHHNCSLKTFLPLGISLYTFQAFSYLIYVYRGQLKAQTCFWEMASYVCMVEYVGNYKQNYFYNFKSYNSKLYKMFFFLLSFLISILISIVIGVKCVMGEEVPVDLILQYLHLFEPMQIAIFWKEFILGMIFTGIISLGFYRCKILLLLLIVFSIIHLNFSKNDGSIYNYYQIPNVHSSIQKNIVVILLESEENIWSNEDIMGENLIPSLSRLKKEGISWEGWETTESTIPTIPALGAVMCGLPVPYTSIENYIALLKENENIGAYKGSICISDILSQKGYKVIHIMGSSSNNENAIHFLKSHSYDTIIDKKYLESKKLSSTLHYSGLSFISDSILFEEAKNQILELASNRKKFFVSIVTANTHGPHTGYRENFCEYKYGDIRDSHLCLDKIVKNFIDWFKIQSFYHDTVILIIGDHQAWNMEFHGIDPLKNRTAKGIYNVLLNSELTNYMRHRWTHLDMGPTLMEAAGFEIKPRKLGLGTSLFSQEQTLLDKFGNGKDLDREIRNSQKQYDFLFNTD